MSDGLSVEAERAQPVHVLRPRGRLDAYSAPDLRAALLDSLAEQPAGIIVDATELEVEDAIGLTTLANVAQQSERWPGSRFALVGPGGQFDQLADRMGVTRHMSICPDEDSARAELRRWPVPARRHDRIAPGRDAPGLARASVVQFCQEHGVGGDGDAAQLVASELVTNAVVHAGTPIDLTLRLLTPLLHIAVRDRGYGAAKIVGHIDESSENGRGLLLVDALAVAWGNFVPDTGKVVWATVRVRPVIGAR